MPYDPMPIYELTYRVHGLALSTAHMIRTSEASGVLGLNDLAKALCDAAGELADRAAELEMERTP